MNNCETSKSLERNSKTVQRVTSFKALSEQKQKSPAQHQSPHSLETNGNQGEGNDIIRRGLDLFVVWDQLIERHQREVGLLESENNFHKLCAFIFIQRSIYSGSQLWELFLKWTLCFSFLSESRGGVNRLGVSSVFDHDFCLHLQRVENVLQ